MRALIAEADPAGFDAQNDPLLGDSAASLVYRAQAPASGAENGLVLADMRGKYYDDPMWEQLLDQIVYSSHAMRECLFEAAYQTGALAEIGKPASTEYDGPQGLTLADTAGRTGSAMCAAIPPRR